MVAMVHHVMKLAPGWLTRREISTGTVVMVFCVVKTEQHKDSSPWVIKSVERSLCGFVALFRHISVLTSSKSLLAGFILLVSSLFELSLCCSLGLELVALHY
ncbi:hypothetical protein C2G38_2039887 [Gigaspora rosea]|uniref:Uncharacterized protein n=1 Tax=Gigaspora rosea TaxID=44941 RepID=A0A397UZI4_9GLOM|nr:hypothetical protein C2G38_2039887 [Gigaspora rosea]